MLTQSSAPLSMPQIANTTISSNKCRFLRSSRGSVNSEKNSKIIALRGFSSASLTACAIGLTLKGGSDIGDGKVVGGRKTVTTQIPPTGCQYSVSSLSLTA